eukprot:scaffold90719_cov22-Tisochrysis_lutea.AAC.1
MLTVLSSRSCVFNSQPTHKEHHINKLNGPGFPVQSSTSRFGLGRRLEARTEGRQSKLMLKAEQDHIVAKLSLQISLPSAAAAAAHELI